MEGLFIVVPILLVLGIMTIIALVSRRWEQKRTVELAELAAEMSLDFSPEGDAALESALSHFSIMQRGRARKLYNLIRGETQNTKLALFDYQYTTGNGKHKTTHRVSVAAFASPQLALPAFELGAENFLHRIAGVFGYQDIDFAGYPTFNKKYLLRGPNEKAIRLIFSEDVVQHFEARLQTAMPIGEVIGHDDHLIVCRSREKPEYVRAFLEDAFATYGVFRGPEDAAGPDELTQ